MKKVLVTTISLIGFLATAATALASDTLPPSVQSKPLFTVTNPLSFTNLGQLISNVITLIFFAAGLAFFLMLLVGGLQWITAGGDPKALQSARARITNAFIGLIIVVAAYAIAAIVGQVFGIAIVNGFTFKSS